jgi:predicted DNA-binding transcriptional regulator YafY
MRDFRSDRIRSLRLLSEVFTGHTDFSLERYLKTAQHDENFDTVIIRFKSDVVETVRRDWSARIVEEKMEGDEVVVTLRVYALNLFAYWVLSFGTKAKVIAPEQLKSVVASEAAKVVAQYASPAKLDLQPWESLLT